jgi:hypothetical protein
MARQLVTLLALSALALVATQAAVAKEGANLTSYPTNGMKVGSPWNARFEAFSHDGNALAPAVLIRNASGKTQRFSAHRTGTRHEQGGPGVLSIYRSDVVFPSAGNWTYGVELRPGGPVQWFDDSPVTIDPAPVNPSPGGFDIPLWLVGLLGALVLSAAASFGARRYVRGRTAIAPQM